MQTKYQLEEWYKSPDPWGYQTNPEDDKRKRIILDVLNDYAVFDRALDIGCGEGVITKDLPAKEIHGLELSDNASLRLPKNVKRIAEPKGEYDLILLAGVLYEQYDYQLFHDWVSKHAVNIVLTCNIASWEINNLPKEKQVLEKEFDYREYKQKLRVFVW
jgi:trans-aconitate methyltransferase